MIEKILRFSIYHATFVVLLTITVACYGMYSFVKLPIDAVPDITNNQVQINTLLPGFSPIQIEKQVTYVIETSLAGIPGLQTTRSISRNGFSQVTAIFDEDVDVYFARQQINERLTQMKSSLPEGTDIKMGPISTGLGEIYMWTVDFKHPEGKNAKNEIGKPGWQTEGQYLTPEGELLKTPTEKAAYLRTVQDWIVKPQLMGIRGLAGVDSIGGYLKEYHVTPNLEKMIALGLTFKDIIEAIDRNNISVGPGYIEKGGESFTIKADERLENAAQIEAIVVATREGIPIPLRAISEVSIGKEMRSGSATKDGHEAVIGTAMMLIGANSRTVSLLVDERLKNIEKTLPADITLIPVLNRTTLVDGTIKTVVSNLSEGALLVILVLFLFLGQIRTAVITALVIPLSMLLTAIGMIKFGISGNLMSLGAVDFGLIVDGAVILTENSLRRLVSKQHEFKRALNQEERQQEIVEASKEMIQPTVFGQAIIMIVYLPILSLQGIEGKMFHPMAITVMFALFSAFVLSLTFIPAMLTLCLKGHLSEKENKLMEFCKKYYKPILDKCLNAPQRTISYAIAFFLFTLVLFHSLGQEFIPQLDEGNIAMQAMRIPSTSLTQSTDMQKVVEKTLLTHPEVDYVYSKTGTAELASDPMPPNLSDTFIILKAQDKWPDPSLSKNALIAKLSDSMYALPGNNYEFTQPIEMRFNELISGVRSDVSVKIYGDNFDTMHRTALAIANILKKVPGAMDIKVAQTEGLPTLDVNIDREAASRLGINVADGLEVLSIAVGGGKAGQIFEGDRRFNIFVRLPESQRANIEALKKLPIPLPNKEKAHFPYVPLSEIANLKVSEGLNIIQRENGKRFVSVEANIRDRDLGSFVNEATQKVNAGVKVPDGYWLEWGGQFENLLSARNRLMVVVPICLLMILLLLFTAFRSLKYALLVFSGVPLALTGGIIALWIRDMPFSISAGVGFIALSGIAVLNGIVLISAINQSLKELKNVDQAIREGALMRLRPVLMTALVASLGFVPMALAWGTGAEVQKPLATVVIGGLISSTLLTLAVLPALYKYFIPKFVQKTVT